MLLLAQVLRHLDVMPQMGQGFAGPVPQLLILAAFGVVLEQRSRVLVGTDLHRGVVSREILLLGILQLVEFFWWASSMTVGISALTPPATSALSSVDVLV